MRVDGRHSKLFNESRKLLRIATTGVSWMALDVVVFDSGGKPLSGVAEVVQACRVEMACDLADQLDGEVRQGFVSNRLDEAFLKFFCGHGEVFRG